MSRAKLPLKESIELFERAITFPSDEALYFQLEGLEDRTKFAIAQWCRNEDGYSLLHALVYRWSNDIRGRLLDFLLNKGASKNIDVYHQFAPTCYLTPLTYAALLTTDKKLLNRLLEISHHRADILRDALDQRDASSLVESFLADYEEIRNSVNSPSQENRPAPLLKAARKRNLKAFNHLIRTKNNGGTADPTILTVDGNNILHEMVLGIAENNPDGTAPLSDEDQDFFERLLTSRDCKANPFAKNNAGKSPITLACELGQNALIARFFQIKGFQFGFTAESNCQIEAVKSKITKLPNSKLKDQLMSNLEQFTEDLNKIKLADLSLHIPVKTVCSVEELIETVKKISKITGLLFELEKLTDSLSSAKTPDDFNNAKNTFVQNCEGKLYSEKVQDRYNALIGVLIGLVIAAVIVSTLLLFATGGIATFGAAKIISFVAENIAISLAGGAVAAFIVGSLGYCGYHYSDAATWRADFFAAGSAVETHVENTFAPTYDDDGSVPLIQSK